MVTRRTFLGLCLAGGCSAGVAVTPAALAAPGARPDAVRALGGWYLDRHPAENDRGRLIALLEQAVPELAGFDAAGRLPGEDVALRRAFERDYARGDSVYVEGWLFARTELRLCALAAVS